MCFLFPCFLLFHLTVFWIVVLNEWLGFDLAAEMKLWWYVWCFAHMRQKLHRAQANEMLVNANPYPPPKYIYKYIYTVYNKALCGGNPSVWLCRPGYRVRVSLGLKIPEMEWFRVFVVMPLRPDAQGARAREGLCGHAGGSLHSDMPRPGREAAVEQSWIGCL